MKPIGQENRKQSGRVVNRLKQIHQILPDLNYGDAIANHAIAIMHHLRELGYESRIFVIKLDKRLRDKGEKFDVNAIQNDAGVLYHHAIGSGITQFAVEHRGPKCLIYHNITPADFFKPYRPEYAKILEDGRIQLEKLASHFSISAGVSYFNTQELTAFGFKNPTVLPITVSPDKWDFNPDTKLMDRLQDGITNIIFVGRVAPNKRQDDLIEAFSAYLTFDPNARLILIGIIEPADPYYFHVRHVIRKFGLMNHVVFTGKVTDEELQAYYRTAHLFWSMSEHEGFCIPLIESMWFDVPILAYKSSAVPETLHQAGMMFNDKSDLTSIAALANLLVKDNKLKLKVLKSQKKRRQDFLPHVIWPKFDNIIKQMDHQFK